VDLDNDFGFNQFGAIGDTVWCDADYNNQYDAGEGRAGVTVSLYSDAGCDGTADELIGTQETAGDGQYLFSGLEVGVPGQPVCYVVRVDKADMGICNNPITPEEYDVPLDTDNPVDLDNDFGFNQFGAIGDTVWCDADYNNQFNAGEGRAGVTVSLYSDAGCDGTADELIGTQETAGDGHYLFSGLEVGVPGQPVCYVVRVDKADMGTCNNPITPEEFDVPLDTDNPVDLDNDFGFNQFAGLGDYVWYDTDKDGIQDTGESGVSGVTVRLYDCANNLLSTGVTDAAGRYAFTGLQTGTYSLGFVLPANYLFTLKNQGANPAVDSDADPATGRTACTTLEGAEFDPTWDAGIYRTTPPPPPPVVPEASTWLLMGSAAAGLAGYVGLQLRARRRRP
jgi:hypothetical protein